MFIFEMFSKVGNPPLTKTNHSVSQFTSPLKKHLEAVPVTQENRIQVNVSIKNKKKMESGDEKKIEAWHETSEMSEMGVDHKRETYFFSGCIVVKLIQMKL